MRRQSTYNVPGVDTLTRPVVSRPRLSLWLLRVMFTVHLVAVLGQPVLAGMYLAGDVDAIVTHGTIGSLLAPINLLVIAAALVYALGGRGRLWMIPVAVVMFLAVGFQIGAGYSRELELHVPLGVAIVTTSMLLAIWVWSPSAARPRGAR
jgi:hypothetical protein